VWDTATGRLLRTLGGRDKEIRKVLLSSNDKQVITAGDGTVRIWDIDSNSEICEFIVDKYSILDIAASPDRRYAAVSSIGNGVQLWDLEKGKLIRTMVVSHQQGVTRSTDDSAESLSYSPDGHTLVGGDGGGKLRVWDIDTGRESWVMPDHVRAVNSVAISPDGRTVATAGYDHEIHLWALENKTKVRSLLGHTGGVDCVSFSSNGKLIFSGSDDHTIRIWDAQTGREMQSFHGHQSLVRAIGESPQDAMLVSGSFDNTLRFWDLSRPTVYRTLKPEVEAAITVLGSHPTDGQALKILGNWYAFRGMWRDALELLEAAREHGEGVDPLVVGRAEWMEKQFAKATHEFEAALTSAQSDEERLYIRLCRSALMIANANQAMMK
jgi:WD40 repeat protein